MQHENYKLYSAIKEEDQKRTFAVMEPKKIGALMTTEIIFWGSGFASRLEFWFSLSETKL